MNEQQHRRQRASEANADHHQSEAHANSDHSEHLAENGHKHHKKNHEHAHHSHKGHHHEDHEAMVQTAFVPEKLEMAEHQYMKMIQHRSQGQSDYVEGVM
jgi:hypothetical protein